ncbi:MAG TPA: AmmeMemoRadiSam system protein B [Burkholderiaceae bacterium]|nr:AmmeMemoRadiSam system protein B [Burkholderiaceae bacterium]
MDTTTRPAAVAGLFYPADAKALSRQLDRLLAAAASTDDAPAPKILVVPHAGYVYSGPVAAFAYARLARWRTRIRRIVLLGPTHRVAVHGLAVPTATAFDTPLGRVELDRDAIAALSDLPQVVANDAAHAQEHALEVQLPFLQSVLDRFTLVPLAVGAVSADAVAQVIERLWGGVETLIVISTDLSHYLPYAKAKAVDRETVERIVHLEPLLDHQQACGATPLAGALLAARQHGLTAQLLDLRNSGDTAGDRSRVVGYCAIALAASAASDARVTSTQQSTDDDAGLGGALLARARNAIADALSLPQIDEPAHPALRSPGATFVTLRRRGALRGCVGTLTAVRPLADDVRMQALCAAFRDARFTPLTRDEFDGLEIEVSVVEPALPIAARSEADACAQLRPGVDGVILQWRGVQATLLPQVWQRLPDPRDFLAALKQKAGLAPSFWNEGVKLSRYRVRHFADSESTG